MERMERQPFHDGNGDMENSYRAGQRGGRISNFMEHPAPQDFCGHFSWRCARRFGIPSANVFWKSDRGPVRAGYFLRCEACGCLNDDFFPGKGRSREILWLDGGSVRRIPDRHGFCPLGFAARAKGVTADCMRHHDRLCLFCGDGSFGHLCG